MLSCEVLCFEEGVDAAQRLAAALRVPCREVATHRFPDDETLVRVPLPVADHVVVYRGLDRPNNKLIELMLAARTLRDKGARKITLVAPYLCYMRQDAENNPGEAVSQRIVGPWLADLFDELITVDAHLHRVKEIAQAVPARRAVNLTAAAALGAFVRGRGEPLLLGPDGESAQWVAQMARAARLDFAVASKVRHGDERVEITLPEVELRNRDVVLVDDVVSSGGTLVTICAMLRARGVGNIDVAVTHPLFAHDALEKLRRAGVRQVWSTDSINHETNAVHLAAMLAAAVSTG